MKKRRHFAWTMLTSFGECLAKFLVSTTASKPPSSRRDNLWDVLLASRERMYTRA
jgi:hypothetical protein